MKTPNAAVRERIFFTTWKYSSWLPLHHV